MAADFVPALPIPTTCLLTPRSISAFRTISTSWRRTSRRRSASTSSTCSIPSTKSGTGRASASSRRNSGPAAASISASNRKYERQDQDHESRNGAAPSSSSVTARRDLARREDGKPGFGNRDDCTDGLGGGALAASAAQPVAMGHVPQRRPQIGR